MNARAWVFMYELYMCFLFFSHRKIAHVPIQTVSMRFCTIKPFASSLYAKAWSGAIVFCIIQIVYLHFYIVSEWLQCVRILNGKHHTMHLPFICSSVFFFCCVGIVLHFIHISHKLLNGSRSCIHIMLIWNSSFSKQIHCHLFGYEIPPSTAYIYMVIYQYMKNSNDLLTF